MRKYRWIVISVLCLIALVAVVRPYFFFFDYDYNLVVAESDCRNLSKMCEAYRLKPQSNNQWPERLEDLVLDKPGVLPVLDGGLNAIRDPWTKPYRYARFDSSQGTYIYVWTEYEEDKALHILGVRRGPDGRLMKYARSKY